MDRSTFFNKFVDITIVAEKVRYKVDQCLITVNGSEYRYSKSLVSEIIGNISRVALSHITTQFISNFLANIQGELQIKQLVNCKQFKLVKNGAVCSVGSRFSMQRTALFCTIFNLSRFVPEVVPHIKRQ